jgi:hypothetical protein
VIQDFDGGGGGAGGIIDNEGVGHDTAHWVHGAIWQKYAGMGGPDSFLHRPLDDEGPAASPYGTVGRANHFEGGSIQHSGLGTFFTKGSIHTRYSELGESGSPLGFPTTDEMDAPNSSYGSGGWYQHYEGGGIYASREYGTFEVYGSIGQLYRGMGEITGVAGFPKTGEVDAGTSPQGTSGRYNAFERGGIHYTARYGAFYTSGKIEQAYGDNGGSTGRYGFPTSPMYAWAGGTRQDFEGGYIAVDVAGSLHVETQPSGVPVTVDGYGTKTSPADWDLPPGDYRVSFGSGGGDWVAPTAQTAHVEAGQTETVSGAFSPSAPSCLPGDVNGDGTVDLGDAILALRGAVLKVNLPGECAVSGGDVNCNGGLDIGDAILILRNAVLKVSLDTCSQP